MKVVIFEPRPKEFYWFHTNIRTPHLGPPILARILNERGHEAIVASELVQPLDYSVLDDVDLVGISVSNGLVFQRAWEIVAEVRRRRPDVPIVAGGHQATLLGSETLKHVDYLVRGYAEEAFPELAEALHSGERRPTTQRVSYIDPVTGRQIDNPSRRKTDISTRPDLDTIIGYRDVIHKNRTTIHGYGTYLPLSYYSRGCAFSCNFCAIPLADDASMGTRTAREVVDDLVYQMGFYNRPINGYPFWLIDDNFGQNKPATKEFLQGLIDAKLPLTFVVQARVELGNDPELLAMMRKAGFTSIYLGLESFTEENLTTMNKNSSLQKIEKAVNAVHAAGIDVVALMVFGSDGDRPGVSKTTLKCLRKLDIRYLNPQIICPYPGTAFNRQLQKEGRLFSTDFSYCNMRPVFFSRTIRPSQAIVEIYKISKAYLSRYMAWKNLLTRKDWQTFITRRGVVTSGYLGRILDWIPLMENIENEYYTTDHYLKEDLLQKHRDNGLFEEKMSEFMPREFVAPQLAANTAVHHDPMAFELAEPAAAVG